MPLVINADFEEVLEPFGKDSANFFLAAALYHAHQLSFAAAAAHSGLGTADFAARLREHYETGYLLDDQVVAEDIRMAVDQTLKNQCQRHLPNI